MKIGISMPVPGYITDPAFMARKAEELGVPLLDEAGLVELLRAKGLMVD